MSTKEHSFGHPLEEEVEDYFRKERASWVASHSLKEKLSEIPQLHPQQEESRLGWSLHPFWYFLASATMACFVYIVEGESPSEAYTSKGISWDMLYAHKRTRGYTSTHRARSGITLHPDDAIQFTYRVPEKLYLFILSMNQKGEITSLVHREDKKAIRVLHGKGVFPRRRGRVKSFQLDGYIGLERFFFVASRRPFPWQNLKRLLHQSWIKHSHNIKKMSVPHPQWLIRSIWIKKRPRPTATTGKE